MSIASRLTKLERTMRVPDGECMGGKAHVFLSDHPIPDDLPPCRKCGERHVVIVDIVEEIVS